MTAEMSRALEESIAHWKRMREKPWTEEPNADGCSLCDLGERSSVLVYDDNDRCSFCCIPAVSGDDYCRNTPFRDAAAAHCDITTGPQSLLPLAMLTWFGLNWRIAADREIAFLESLREV